MPICTDLADRVTGVRCTQSVRMLPAAAVEDRGVTFAEDESLDLAEDSPEGTQSAQLGRENPGEPRELVVPDEYRGAGRTIDRPGVESLECPHVGVSGFSAGLGEELSGEVGIAGR